jgi:hypothetical protein
MDLITMNEALQAEITLQIINGNYIIIIIFFFFF